jgi:hypothetical protein
MLSTEHDVGDPRSAVQAPAPLSSMTARKNPKQILVTACTLTVHMSNIFLAACSNKFEKWSMHMGVFLFHFLVNIMAYKLKLTFLTQTNLSSKKNKQTNLNYTVKSQTCTGHRSVGQKKITQRPGV